MLKIEDLRIGMKVYINATGYGVLTVSKLGVAGFFTEKGYFNYKCSWIDWGKTASLNELSAQEQSQHTFDDLIDVAVQAYKDRLSDIEIDTQLQKVFVKELKVTYGCGDIELGIKGIKSLYKETFVIECEGDLKRIKKGAKILLLNGNSLEVMYVNLQELHVAPVADYRSLDILSLKGATVEQERGRDD